MTRHIVPDAGFTVSSIWFAVEPPGTWTHDAACRGHAPLAAFFTESATFAEADPALAVCPSCPVWAACLDYGKRLQADGVWGGQLLHHGVVQQRRRLYTRRAQPPRLAAAERAAG